MRKLIWVIALLLAAPAFFAPALAQKAEAEQVFPDKNPKATLPDKQPEKGPGSSDYAHKKVEVVERGEKGKKYWLYTPAEPAPEKAPVVAFIHGYGALTPDGYIEWLHHLCRRGNIVVYPQYQEHRLEPTVNYAPNSAHAINDAIAWLEEDKKRVQPQKDKFAIAGHSAGGVTTANLAADWETLKLPKPRAAMPVQPGRAFSYESKAQAAGLIPHSDFSNIPEDCLLLPVFGDSDTTVGSYCAKKYFMDATKVKKENKNLVEFVSCDYCRTPLIAGHFTPAAPEGTADAWDWYGYWKLLDGLTDAAFYGKNREHALGDTPQQRFMGKYSDGRPVCELKVWLGDAKLDPDKEYSPVFDRSGKRLKAAEPKKEESNEKREPKGDTPGRKEDKDEKKEEEF